MDDTRVQAIRCRGCHRLRPHPDGSKPETLSCLCGDRRFTPSFPMPGEEAWALQVYESEIKERELWKHT